MSTAFWLLVCFLAGLACGWIQAHQTVAYECEKLGRFYVGHTVFECKARAALSKGE